MFYRLWMMTYDEFIYMTIVLIVWIKGYDICVYSMCDATCMMLYCCVLRRGECSIV